jgi:hypothetical protein
MRRPLLCWVKLSPYETCGLEGPGTLDSGNPSLEGASKSQPRWYLVQCRARQDERALEHLQRQGFECYRRRGGYSAASILPPTRFPAFREVISVF